MFADSTSYLDTLTILFAPLAYDDSACTVFFVPGAYTDIYTRGLQRHVYMVLFALGAYTDMYAWFCLL